MNFDLLQWKRRWCVLRRLSPVANSLIMELYKKPLLKSKDYQSKSSINVENLLGLESCFLLQKESQTLAVICKSVIILLAFENREILLEWQSRISDILGQGTTINFIFFFFYGDTKNKIIIVVMYQIRIQNLICSTELVFFKDYIRFI